MAAGYWRLLGRLEQSIDREDPAVHSALRDMLAALSAHLSAQGLGAEMSRRIASAAPLLSVAHSLGCAEGDLRRLNSIADSLIVEGDLTYV